MLVSFLSKLNNIIYLSNFCLSRNSHGHTFADNIFKLIILYENCILIQISLKYVPMGPN